MGVLPPMYFFKEIYLSNVYQYAVAVLTHQKATMDPITDGYEPPCGCWELNSGPQEEQTVLLVTLSFLQPTFHVFK